MKGGYWIIHGCVLFIFLGNCGLFYILRDGGDGPLVNENRSRCNVDTLPDIMADEVADDRMEAFNQATMILSREKKEREMQEEHNSFHFFAEDVEEVETSVPELQATEEPIALDVKKESRTIGRQGSGNARTSSGQKRPSVVEEAQEVDDEVAYYAALEMQKRKEKKEREQRLYELYYGDGKPDEMEKTEMPRESEQQQKPVVAPPRNGFKTMGGASASQSKGSVRAVVHGEQRNITSSSQVKLRILDPIEVDGFVIPRNTLILGQASFRENRVNIHIENIAYNNNVYPFRGVIYDQDGFQGIYFPDNLANDVKKEAGNETASSVDVKLGSLRGIVSTGANAIVNATKNATAGAIRETKVTLPANYKLLIKTVE